MAFDKQSIIDEFSLKPFGSKGWLRSNDLVCPNCQQGDEFALKFTDNGAVLHCLHGKSCNNYSTSLKAYLRSIGKSDLVEYERSINIDTFPSFDESEEVEEEVVSLSIKKPPIAFKRLNFDEYLESRNFLPEHYELFKIGESKLDPRIKNHIVFQFFNKAGDCIAWMSRSRRSKEWHDNNLKNFRNGIGSLSLRYNNSPDTDFSRVLGGENEITEETDTLILVEGIMDKVNVDKELELLSQEEIKCCFTFGNIVSTEQIDIINKYSNIKNIYLLYDEGTITQSKHYGLLLSETNKNIQVCEIKQKGVDPGDLKSTQLLQILEESENELNFNISKIDGIV